MHAFDIAVAMEEDRVSGRDDPPRLAKTADEVAGEAVGGDVGEGDAGLLDGFPHHHLVVEGDPPRLHCMGHPCWVCPKL